jgi:hypothetical protein
MTQGESGDGPTGTVVTHLWDDADRVILARACFDDGRIGSLVRHWRSTLSGDDGYVVVTGIDVDHEAAEALSHRWSCELTEGGFRIVGHTRVQVIPGHYASAAEQATGAADAVQASLGTAFYGYVRGLELLASCLETYRFTLVASP